MPEPVAAAATPAPVAVVAPASPEAPASSAEMDGAVIINEDGGAGSKKGKTSLFGEVAPTEAELMGDEGVEGTDKVKVEDSAADKSIPAVSVSATPATPAVPADGKEKNVPAKADAPAKPDTEKSGEKPPTGFVPIAALHEERTKRQTADQELTRLRRENELLSQIPLAPEASEPDGDFKVLTKTEEDQLMTEDTIAYNKYKRDLDAHKEATLAKDTRERTEQRIIDNAFGLMKSYVPDLLDEGSASNQALTTFAAEHGLRPEVLSVLSDPRIKILIPGQKKSIVLGSAAASVVGFIKNLHDKISSASAAPVIDPAAETPAQMETRITEKVTKELMAKFTTDKPAFRSIGDPPGSGEIPDSGKTKFSEEEFKKMTPKEQEKALGG